MARAEWHFSGGPRYCSGCAASGRPCARGDRGDDGTLCPYTEHAPTTVEGWQAWRAAELSGFPLRRLPDGRPIGFDLPTVLTVATAAGFDIRALADLLPAIGTGLMVALANRTDDDG